MKPSPFHPIFRTGDEITLGNEGKPEYIIWYRFPDSWVQRLYGTARLYQSRLLRAYAPPQGLRIFLLMLRDNHFKNKYLKADIWFLDMLET